MLYGKLLLAMLFLTMAWSSPGLAATPLKVVASFSILGDLVANIGGDQVEVLTLVGPDGDAHVYEPSPADAKRVNNADLVVVNGLGFEGWLDRLIKASGYKGQIMVASTGVLPRAMEEKEPEHGHHERHQGEGQGAGQHHHGNIDPHAWQDLANGKIYVKNIAQALSQTDPANAGIYQRNAAAYLDQLESLDSWVQAQFAQIPAAKRRMITSHDAFGYLGAAYGIQILSPMGVSTASEPSAKGIKKLIQQINKEKITAVFVENISDRRLINQIAKESKVFVEGTLYCDALSPKDGPTPTYILMFRNNVGKIVAAMQRGL